MNSDDLSKRSVMVIDGGLFIHLAEALARDFGTVYYWTPWVSPYPSSNPLFVGDGLENIIRVTAWEDYWDKVDLWFFPDVGYGPLQNLLRKSGKTVFGSGLGEKLELNRVWTKEYLMRLNLPVGPYEVITGIEDLADYLKNNDDKWVKVSNFRGDFETFHHETWELTKPMIDRMTFILGEKKNVYEFVVEDPLEPAVEIGYDGILANGKAVYPALLGLEIKDLGLAGVMKSYKDFPEPCKFINEALEPILKDFQYSGMWSTEIRVMGDKYYLTDPCCRSASPPSELYCEMFANYPEVVWHAANGVVCPIEFDYKFGIQTMCYSEWNGKEWLGVNYPQERSDRIKILNKTIINDTVFTVPMFKDHPKFGAVIGLGDTLDEAIDDLKENAEQVKASNMEIKVDCIEKAKEEIEKFEEAGFSFY